MKWQKRGLIYCPDGKLPWARTHAMLPTPILLDGNTIRVYVSFLDGRGVGRIGFVDINAADPSIVLNVSQRPVLDIGAPGAFDDNGVVPSCVIDDGERKYLYYYGFQLGVKVRYCVFSGLAMSDDGGNTFKRYSQAPILDRTDDELFVRSAPFVLVDGLRWMMWYVGGNSWTDVAGKPVPVYKIKYLESRDGMHWNNASTVCIDFKNEDEHGLGRPFVLKDRSVYRMFYSIRRKTKSYRMGFAHSVDGIKWIRKDEEIGMDVSEKGWDSEMICFASALRVGDDVCMFYNGNNFGSTGFGYAVLRQWND